MSSSSSRSLSLFLRGLNLGIEFTGGAEYQVPSTSCSIEEARSAVEAVGVEPSTVTQLGNDLIRVTTEAVDNPTSLKIRSSLAQACAVDPDQVSVQLVGPTWGNEITKKAITALLVFIGLLSVFLALYFDWRMAIAAAGRAHPRHRHHGRRLLAPAVRGHPEHR